MIPCKMSCHKEYTCAKCIRGSLLLYHFKSLESNIYLLIDFINLHIQFQKETSSKMYTPFLNWILLTIWTICAFRVLNPQRCPIQKCKKIYLKEKETYIHFEFCLYQRWIVGVNESVFEMLNINI